MPVIIRSPIVRQWLGSQDPFDRIDGVKGQVVRSMDGRTTQRFEIDGAGFYLKHHRGVGWAEIVKNLLQGRLPILGASNEWLAIERLHQLGLDTMVAAAYGAKGYNPARRNSFLITEELTDIISLEDLVDSWADTPPAAALKWALINKVARISQVMHSAGINHRDLYICHFLLDISAGVDALNPATLRLFLIDLHRTHIRKTVPLRWRVKDIASLYFSILQAGFSRRDIYRFLRQYCQQPLRTILTEHQAFLRAVEQRAIKLYRRDFKAEPVLPG